MIPCLYEKTETAFDTNGIGKLSDTISCVVTEKRNSSYELEMEYPSDGLHANSIQEGMIILARPAPDIESQPFRIYKITTPLSGILKINAYHISYQLNYITISPFDETGCAETLADIEKENTGFTFTTDIKSDGDFSLSAPASIRNCLGGIEGSVLDTFGGEYEWDRFNVILHKKRGEDNGVRIVYGKNLIDFTMEKNIEEVITGIHPYYKNPEDGTVIELTEKIIQNESDYPKIVVLDCTEHFDEEPTEDELREYAQNYLESTTLTEPSIDIDIDFLELSKVPGYEDVAEAESVNLCDTVYVYITKLNIEVSCKVTETEFDVLLDRYKSITLSNSDSSSRNSSLSSTLSDISNAASTALTVANGAVNYKYLNVNYVNAEELEATYATLEYIKANYTTTEYLSANYATIAILTGNYAKLNDLDTLKADITELFGSYAELDYVKSNYANIELANVSAASAWRFFADVGIVETLTVGEVESTYLNSVNINADVITAGTLSVDRLLITGEDGLIYEINASCSGLSTTELEDTTYQELMNGTCIVANSITAKQIAAGTITANEIDVSNLFAQDITATGSITGLELIGGSININDVFIVDPAGNLTATSGTIGGFTINATNLTGTVTKSTNLTGEVVLDPENSKIVISENDLIMETSNTLEITVSGIKGTTQSGQYFQLLGDSDVVQLEFQTMYFHGFVGNQENGDDYFYVSSSGGISLVAGADILVEADFLRSSGTIIVSTSATTSVSDGVNATYIGNGSIELSYSTPYIDFHYGKSTSDYTSRIIARSSTVLGVTSHICTGSKTTSTDGVAGAMLTSTGNLYLTSNSSTTYPTIYFDNYGAGSHIGKIYEYSNSLYLYYNGNTVQIATEMTNYAYGISLANGKSLYGKDSSGTNNYIAYVNSSNYVVIGNPNNTARTYIQAGTNLVLRSNSGYTTYIVPYSSLSTSSTGTVFQICSTTTLGQTTTSSSTVILCGGCDSTSPYIRSYATYARTGSSAANVNVTSSGTFNRYSSSSYRYKNTINYLSNEEYASDDALSKSEKTISDDSFREKMREILKLPVVQFHYNEGYMTGEPDYDYTQYEVGLIAEDVYKNVPDATQFNEDGTIEMWNVNKIVPRMLFVLQEHEANLSNYDERLMNLEDENQSLKERILILEDTIEKLNAL